MNGCSTIFLTTSNASASRTALLATGHRHHRRRDGEMHDVFEAEDQRHRHGRLLAKGDQRQPRPHIADIAVGGGQPLDRRFGDLAARPEHRCHEHQAEDDEGRKDRPKNVAPLGQPLDRRFGQKLEKQRRQRDIDDERVHPAQRFERLAGYARNREPHEDEAEERQDQPKNVRHWRSISTIRRGASALLQRTVKRFAIELRRLMRQIAGEKAP